MKTKNFLASCAKATFALATVVMMSGVFTSCSKDNDDNNNGPLPDAKPNTVVIDGTERKVVSAEYRSREGVSYYLYLNLNASGTEYISLAINESLHTTGKPIDLTQKEENVLDPWEISYVTPDGKYPIFASGNSNQPQIPVFGTGTLTINGSVLSTISILLKNGRVVGKNGKECTFTLNYSGKLTSFKN
jgi:hypothetical protein